jgi:hypothetical protein
MAKSRRADLCTAFLPAVQRENKSVRFLKDALMSDEYHSVAERGGPCLVLSPLRWRVAVTAGRKMGDSGSDSRRALLGVVAWILVLLAGYWLATEWQTLPALASSLFASVR